MRFVNLDEIEAAALARLAPMARDYFRSGAGAEVTLRENRAAWDRLPLHYRVLNEVGRPSLATTALGSPVALPVLAAPTAFQRLAHADGELATAQAVAAAGSVMVLSSLATTDMEDVAKTGVRWWFQLYIYRDRGATRALVERAAAAGAEALVVTVDSPVLGLREADIHNRFHLPPGLRVCNAMAGGAAELPMDSSDSGLSAWFERHLAPDLGLADVAWLRGISNMPVLVKGVVRADDACRAVRAGAKGVVVSNHGGRQLDTAPATADVLGRIADAVGDRAEIYVDGGVRRGTDVLKALALGARAVLIGRPVLWGLAVDGEAGVSAVFEVLTRQLDRAFALAGCPSPAYVDRTLLTGG